MLYIKSSFNSLPAKPTNSRCCYKKFHDLEPVKPGRIMHGSVTILILLVNGRWVFFQSLPNNLLIAITSGLHPGKKVFEYLVFYLVCVSSSSHACLYQHIFISSLLILLFKYMYRTYILEILRSKNLLIYIFCPFTFLILRF